MVLYPNAEILKKIINEHLESKTIFILMPVSPQTLSLFTEMPGDSIAQENLAIVTLNQRFQGSFRSSQTQSLTSTHQVQFFFKRKKHVSQVSF